MMRTFLIYSLYCQGLILASWVMGCCFMRRSWQSWYKLLVAMCCVTTVVESTSLYFLLHGLNGAYVYNAWLPVETFTITFIFLRGAEHSWARRVCRILLVVFPFSVVIAYIRSPVFSIMNVYTAQAGVFTQLIASCVSLVDLLQNKNSLNKPLTARPMFWAAIGMLSAASLFSVLISMVQLLERTKFFWEVYMPVSGAANTCMYGGFIACFITLRRKITPSADFSQDSPPPPLSPGS